MDFQNRLSLEALTACSHRLTGATCSHTNHIVLALWFISEPPGRPKRSARPGLHQRRVHSAGRRHTTCPNHWEADNEESYLEVVPNERLTFTDLLYAVWTPAPKPGLGFTTTVLFEDAVKGQTKYMAIARHGTAQGREQHMKMGNGDRSVGKLVSALP